MRLAATSPLGRPVPAPLVEESLHARSSVSATASSARLAGTCRTTYWKRLSWTRGQSEHLDVVDVQPLREERREVGRIASRRRGSAMIICPSTDSASGSPVRWRISARGA